MIQPMLSMAMGKAKAEGTSSSPFWVLADALCDSEACTKYT